MRRPALAFVIGLALAGCIDAGGGTAEDGLGATDDAGPTAPATREVRHEFAGTQTRVLGDEYTIWTGDAPWFCFEVPGHTRSIEGTLVWDGPQQMGLEFHPPDAPPVQSWGGDPATAFTDTSPVTLAVEAPAGGIWFAYAGPGVVGAEVAWRLEMVLTVPTDIPLEDVEAPAQPCPQ